MLFLRFCSSLQRYGGRGEDISDMNLVQFSYNITNVILTRGRKNQLCFMLINTDLRYP